MDAIPEILVVATLGEGVPYLDSGLLLYSCEEQGLDAALDLVSSAVYFTELATEHPDFEDIAELLAESIVSVP